MNDPSIGVGRPRVSVLNSPLIGQQFVLGGPFAAIGRNADCEVQLDLVSISRRHAVIEEVGGRFIVRDLGSRNGIKVAGRPVAQAELRHGDVISVGEVELRFEHAAPRAVAGGTSVAQPPARALTAMDIMSAAPSQSGYNQEEAPAEAGPAFQRNPKLIIAVVLGLVIAVAVGWAIVRQPSAGSGNKPKDLGVDMVAVGGNLILSWTSGFADDFEPGNIFIDEPSVVEASRYDQRCLLVTGKSGGSTTVTVKTKRGVTVTCRILVKGRIFDPTDALTFGNYTDAERLSMAERFSAQAAALEREQPFRALRKYEETLAVLKPMPHNNQLYIEANNRAKVLRSVIEERWDKLEKEIRIAAGNNDLIRIEDLLADARELIPDENDPRYQKVKATRLQVLQAVLKEKNQ